MNEAVGVFGGTFDPVHLGHLVTAQAVKELRGLRQIIFIPAFISPLKTDKQHTASKHRLEMLKLAISGIEYFTCSDYELQKKGISFTIDTLKELKKEYSSIELIIGFDNLLVFDSWKNPEEIFELAKVIVLERQTGVRDLQNKFLNKAILVKTPVIEISATEIRERVSSSLPIDFFVPEKVKEYIYKHKLYKENKY